MSANHDKASPAPASAGVPRWQAPAFWVLRLGLGALFVYAGAMKLGTPADFATEIANYHLGSELAPLMAVTMPTVEIVLGLGLIAGTRPWARAAALGAAALLGVFTLAVTTVVARGINVDCGCFGGNSGPVTMVTVLRDVVLFLCAAAIVRLAALDARERPARTEAEG